MLLDPESVGTAFVILLLSCMEAETLRYSTCTPANGGQLDLNTHPDVGEFSHYSFAVLLSPEHVGVAFGILLISYIEAEILCFMYFR